MAGPHAGESDRAPLVLGLAIASFVLTLVMCTACGPLALLSLGLSIPAIVMGRRDLADVRAGRKNPAHRDLTQAGLIIAIVSAALSALTGIVMLGLMLLYGAIFGVALLGAAAGG
jgi:hypothetical protein